MSNPVAVVTGSNGLTGQAICRNLQARGYTVVGIDIADSGKGDFGYRKCDVTDYQQIAVSYTHLTLPTIYSV